MQLEAIAHELVTLAIAQNASRIVEIDRMLDILKRMFPQQTEPSITAQLIREVRLMDGAVAWMGADGYLPKAHRQAPGSSRHH